MKNLSMYNENKDFEKVVTKFYGEEFCEVLIGWTDALGYRLIKTDLMGEFQLWESDSFDNNIAVNTDEIVNINDVISIVSKEIDIALDEFKGIEENKLSEDDIEAVVGAKIAKNIIAARTGNVKIQAGGGGVYGKLTAS